MIGDIVVDGRHAVIHDESGRPTNYSLTLEGTLEGWNSRRIVVRDRDYAKLYDDRGKQIGSMIWLGGGRYIKSVTPNSILVKEGSYVRRFNNDGHDTGEMTYDPN